MIIAIDAFGGDNAPLEVIKGAISAKSASDVDIILCGNKEEIKKCAADNNLDLSGLKIKDAKDVISMHDQPTDILKSKNESSMAVALKTVADGEADAFVSAGSTGAIVVGATFIIKRLKGIKRAALGSIIPGRNKNFLMMDVGANAECRPEMLQQFAIMSSIYMKNVMNVANPEVALLNIGTEETKGGQLQLDTYALLKKSPINFIGNVEARDLPKGVCDAIITDGFTGNIALKLYEGVSLNIFSMLKEVFYKNLKTKLAALVVKPGLSSIKKKADYSEIGGAPLLGVKKPVIKAHGSSNDIAFKNAILLAAKFAENDVIGAISNDLSKMKESITDECKD